LELIDVPRRLDSKHIFLPSVVLLQLNEFKKLIAGLLVARLAAAVTDDDFCICLAWLFLLMSVKDTVLPTWPLSPLLLDDAWMGCWGILLAGLVLSLKARDKFDIQQFRFWMIFFRAPTKLGER
jgi:hypothetical protein